MCLQINEALRLLRVFYDLSQEELATKLEISKSYLFEIESGKKNGTIDLLEKYSQALGIPVSSIIFFAENIGKKVISQSHIDKKIIAIINFLYLRDI